MKRWLISDIADNWKRAYCRDGIWNEHGNPAGTRESIYQGIIAAGSDVKKIDAAIGNPTWTHFKCEECNEYKSNGVIFEDTELETVLCSDCLHSACALLSS